MVTKTKSPLRKRLLRELRSEFGKYLVIFILLTFTIGFVSGFLVADGSMIVAYDESFAKYNIEDGHFTLNNPLNRAQKKSIEALDVTLCDISYYEEALDNDSTMRIFQNRTQMNLACLMDGAFPTAPGEIAIDRMYADNNDLQVGDEIRSAERTYTVTGLVALSDYSALFSNNNDTMFDSVKFGVAVVSAEQFADYPEDNLIHCYAWKYSEEPADDEAERELSEDFLEKLTDEVKIETYIPRYQNQAIVFTGDDMGSDKGMMMVLLYIIIAIMAFVFAITISNTILREANVIGTLRAMGYGRGELVRHYMTMPMLVTLIGALVGNILGYTVFKDVCAGMYYGSYSLPTYVTIWSAEAFVMTTVVPVILMAVINAAVLIRKMRISPLQFLRRNVSGKTQRHAFPLPKFIRFFDRFRLRVIFQNRSNYIMLFVGILFANLLLIWGLGLPAVLDWYQSRMESNLLCNYQYLLTIPTSATDDDRKLESMIYMLQFQSAVQTENETAETFSAYSLNTNYENYKTESVTMYGVQEDSRYISLDGDVLDTDEDVYISSAYAEKYDLAVGDSISLKEAYETDEYTFRVAGIYDYMGAIAVFMEQEQLNRVFDLGEDYYCGYLSDTEITDIDEQYIGTIIDMEALTKVSRQLDVSMGSMMGLVDGFAVLIFVVLIYLLSKIIIEKNAQSISMAKILGYTNMEISRLYILSTTIVVVVCILISIPVEVWLLKALFHIVMLVSMTGWIPIHLESDLYVKMFVIGFATYLAVAMLEYRRIRRVPMDEALKNVE